MLPTRRSSIASPRAGLARRHWRWIGLAALVLAAALGYKGWRIYTLAQALLDDARTLEALAEAGPSLDSAAPVGPLLAAAREHAVALRAEAAPFVPLSPVFGWLPVYGGDIAAARPLLDFAAEITAAADEAFAALSPLLMERDAGTPMTAALVERLVAEADRLEFARQSVGRAADAWAQVDVTRLSPRLSRRLGRVESLLPMVQDGLELIAVVPDLMGADGPRTYLLIAQNEDEIRATGGFISGAGTITFDAGRMVDFSIGDSYSVDDLTKPYPSPPEPLLRYMAASIWLFRDSNWSPDFPSSAKIGMDLYALGQGRELDGVVAFDQTAIRMLLAAVGPVTVEGTPDPVSADNVVAYMRRAWSPAEGQGLTREWWAQRKSFMGRLGRAILARLESDSSSLDPMGLANAAQRMLDERHVLIYLREPVAASALSERGWDGALRPGDGDYLMVVDSNVGFNKVNVNIGETVTYAVDLTDPAAPTASATVRHTHRLDASVECRHVPDYGGGVYEEMMARCYWDYLRVLMPGASELLDWQVTPTPAEWLLTGEADEGTVTFGGGEAGTSFAGVLLVVPTGEARETVFRYRLPAEVVVERDGEWRYSLTVQKQAGTHAIPYSIEVTLPSGAELVASSPEPAARDGDRVGFEFELAEDQVLEVVFRMP